MRTTTKKSFAIRKIWGNYYFFYPLAECPLWQRGSQLGPNRAASNPRVPARSPGLAPRALTRPPTGPITRGKTNKGSYYTLLMKDTRGEAGHAGHHRNKRALTDPSFTTTTTTRPLTPSPPPRITPRLWPNRTHAFVVRDSRGSVEVGEVGGASWPVNWVSPLREHVAQRGLTGGRGWAASSQEVMQGSPGERRRDALKMFPSLIQRRVYSHCCSGSNKDTKNLNTSQCQSASAVIWLSTKLKATHLLIWQSVKCASYSSLCISFIHSLFTGCRLCRPKLSSETCRKIAFVGGFEFILLWVNHIFNICTFMIRFMSIYFFADAAN